MIAGLSHAVAGLLLALTSLAAIGFAAAMPLNVRLGRWAFACSPIVAMLSLGYSLFGLWNGPHRFVAFLGALLGSLTLTIFVWSLTTRRAEL